ncbi:MAG: beta-lactamase family protein [Planctomycetes bacterium]|nr:beta-lactamase family protein [Planctomycetota bacterium]
MHRALAALALLTPALVAVADLPQSQSPPVPVSMPVSRYVGWQSLAELLAASYDDVGAPGLAIAVVRSGVTTRAVCGMRRADGAAAIEPGDRFHIGSLTKSFTATLVGRLVELGQVGFEAKAGEVLDDIAMLPAYRDATLADLLRHRAGLRNVPTGGIFAAGFGRLDLDTPAAGRLAVVQQILQEEPAVEPRTVMSYSNAGYVVAALMIERQTGSTWEELMRRHVLGPCELASADFGWPARADRLEQPFGHFGQGPDLAVQELGVNVPGDVDLRVFLAPAGDLSMSIEDLARYAEVHLRGLRGQEGILRAATVRQLHRPPEQDEPGDGYACGWALATAPDDSERHWHAGSAGTFYALVTLYPGADLAVVSASNAGFHAADAHAELHRSVFLARRQRGGDARRDETPR